MNDGEPLPFQKAFAEAMSDLMKIPRPPKVTAPLLYNATVYDLPIVHHLAPVPSREDIENLCMRDLVKVCIALAIPEFVWLEVVGQCKSYHTGVLKTNIHSLTGRRSFAVRIASGKDSGHHACRQSGCGFRGWLGGYYRRSHGIRACRVGVRLRNSERNQGGGGFGEPDGPVFARHSGRFQAVRSQVGR